MPQEDMQDDLDEQTPVGAWMIVGFTVLIFLIFFVAALIVFLSNSGG